MDKDTSTAKLILNVLAYVALFAVPTAVLAILFSAYAVYIILVGIGLILAVTGLLIGLGWDNPDVRREDRSNLKTLLITVVVAPVVVDFARGDRDLIYLIGFPALVLLPFHVGRSIRRRRHTDDGLTEELHGTNNHAEDTGRALR